jgi:hypothetical protein
VTVDTKERVTVSTRKRRHRALESREVPVMVALRLFLLVNSLDWIRDRQVWTALDLHSDHFLIQRCRMVPVG